MRRAFEDAVLETMRVARRDAQPASLVVATVMGLAPVSILGGASAVERTVARVLALVRDLTPRGARVELIGGTEIGILLPGADEAMVGSVCRDIELGVELLDREFPNTRLGFAVGIAVGPEPAPGADADLLWRTADRAFRNRATVVQQGVQNLILPGAVTLDEVARRLLETGVATYALEASTLLIGERQWSVPEPPPERSPDGIRELISSGGASVGIWHWWGERGTPDPLALDEVFLAVANAVERVLAVESSERRARRDGLTGLLNREGLSHAMREVHAPYAVGVVDIDHFKQMNDLHGHEAGDRCLQALADLLRHSRASDLVARWGGEELVVIMPGSTATGAAAGLQRLLDQARSTIVIEDTPLSFSAGVAMVESDLLGVLDGIRAADAAMYEAKRRGRGQVVVSAADAR